MKNMKRSLILGGLTIIGIAVAGYRAYELRKLQTVKEEVVIKIDPEPVQETQK